jgi:hypothetical protein
VWGAASRSIPSFGDLAWKAPVRLATTAALSPATYSAGVLSRSGNGALGTVDGTAPAVGDRLLVKNQASTSTNGIYVVTSLGSGAAPWILTRSTDCDIAAEMVAGLTVLVVAGAQLAGTVWYATAAWTPTTGDPAFTSTPATNVQVFTVSGTWTQPLGAYTAHDVLVIGAGGGGGGGRRGAAASQRGGGGGGQGGGMSWATFAYGELGTSIAVTVGTGGTGGNAAAGDNLNGQPGVVGGQSYIGPNAANALVLAAGGQFGNGGGGGATTAGGTGLGIGSQWGGDGGSAANIQSGSGLNAVGNGIQNATGGGGAGANIDATNVVGSSGAGVGPGRFFTQISAGGVTAGANATPGYSDSTIAAGGGGGGGAVDNAVGGRRDGAVGGIAGGGGGGGGSALNGTSAGRGGAGARGVAVIVTR